MGKLSIVATPIGNLEDITLRALRTLKECDAIYAEDTRVIAKLLSKYGLTKSIFRLDAATEARKADEIIARLQEGEHIALVSDAGTPGISDPGARLLARVHEHISRFNLDSKIVSVQHSVLDKVLDKVCIEAIPGPSALTAALSVAGVNADTFTFLGFLPHKKGRQTALKKIAESNIPVVLYESPHRILKLLEELAQHQVSHIVVCRELTKLHEEMVTGTPAEMFAYFDAHPDHCRGEFVVVVES